MDELMKEQVDVQVNNGQIQDDQKSEQSDEKRLYRIDVELSYEQYWWAVKKSLPLLFGPMVFFFVSVLLVGGIIIFLYSSVAFRTVSAVFFVAAAFLLSARFWIYPRSVKKTYEYLEKNNENIGHYDFYKDRLERISTNGTAIYKYDQFVVCKEDEQNIAAYLPMRKMVMIPKNMCDEEFLQFFRQTVSDEQKKKYQRSVRNRNIELTILMVFICFIVAWSAYSNRPINQYPYSTYESFVGCVRWRSVDEVTIHDDIVTYKYIGDGHSEYYNAKIKGNKEELIEILDEYDIPWSE